MGDGSKRSLRIALISACARWAAPEAGGAEPPIAELARELRILGHRPTVFAPEDPGELPAGDRLAALRHAESAWAQIQGHEFELVQVSYPEALAFSRLVQVPTVATLHHDRDDRLLAHYAAYSNVALVAVSRRQAELAWEIPFRAVIHDGLDVEQYPLGKGGRGCVFLGRLSAENGAHLAIEAARLARSPLALGGEARKPYVDREVAPRLGAGISLAGVLDHMRALNLLSSSRALLCPTQWEEPFSWTMIQSMLVGTPVVAFACGAAPEIVEDGVTGFLVHNVEEMARRIRDVASIDRKACRAHARSRWSAARMARRYEALYVELHERWVSRRRSVPELDGAAFSRSQRATLPQSERSGVVPASPMKAG